MEIQGFRPKLQGSMFNVYSKFRVGCSGVNVEGSRFKADGSGAKGEACIDKAMHRNIISYYDASLYQYKLQPWPLNHRC